MSRRESVARTELRKQSASGPPVQENVWVAVLPPRLPEGMAPPTGAGAAGCFGWDESINYLQNKRPENEDANKKKSMRKKLGLTSERQKANPDAPPFVMRQLPYDTWRKHYAKDKNGFYHGTHAPAEDCLLLPEDVAKWRFGEATSNRDRWTRGSEALPVYAEIQGHPSLPEYEDEWSDPLTPAEPTVSNTEDSHVRQASIMGPSPSYSQTPSQVIANGKTAEQIIEEAKAKKAAESRSQSWKDSVKRGAEFAMMGAGH